MGKTDTHKSKSIISEEGKEARDGMCKPRRGTKEKKKHLLATSFQFHWNMSLPSMGPWAVHLERDSQ